MRIPGAVLSEVGVYVGIASNNVAEYSGLIAGLESALERDPVGIRARPDGLEAGRRADVGPVEDQASRHAGAREPGRERSSQGRDVSFEWVPRLSNKRADAAANESMDRRGELPPGPRRWTGLTGATWIVLGRAGDAVVAAFLGRGRRRAASGARSRRRTLAAWVADDRGDGFGALGLERHAALVRRSARMRACASRAATTCACATRSCATPRWSPRTQTCGGRRVGRRRRSSRRADAAPALFELGPAATPSTGPARRRSTRPCRSSPDSARRSTGSSRPGRLRLLTAAESAGALIAVELRAAGLPWDAATHEAS